MGRRDNFEEGHGAGDNNFFRITPEEAQYLKDVSSAAQEISNWRQESARHPVDMNDPMDLKMHLIQAHGWNPQDLTHYDESAHDPIPSLRNRSRNWNGPTVPELDVADVRNIHTHEHTESEYASDYPHTTLGSSHFHH